MPIPISPKPITLQSGSGIVRLNSAPLFNACSHSSALIAGVLEKFFVPRPIFAATKSGCSGKSPFTPASTTCKLRLCCLQYTFMAAPPLRKFSTICAVTSWGNGLTPSSVIPWSPAKTRMVGLFSSGVSVF